MDESLPDDSRKTKAKSGSERQSANAQIGSKLRNYYDSIVEEGTPAHFLDLLERLQDAEDRSKK